MGGFSWLARRPAAAGDPTHALFAAQSHSIVDNLVALFEHSRAWNCSNQERALADIHGSLTPDESWFEASVGMGSIDRRRGGIIQVVVGLGKPIELFRRRRRKELGDNRWAGSPAAQHACRGLVRFRY